MFRINRHGRWSFSLTAIWPRRPCRVLFYSTIYGFTLMLGEKRGWVRFWPWISYLYQDEYWRWWWSTGYHEYQRALVEMEAGHDAS